MGIFTTKLLGLALTGLILSSCSQMATFDDADLANEQAVAEKAGAKLTPFGTGNMNAMILEGGGDYLVNCITPESGDEFNAYGDLSAGWGGGPNAGSKTLDVKVWNTLTTIEYRLTLASTNANGNNLQYYDEVSETWLAAGSLTVGVEKVISRPLDGDWMAGDIVTEQWRQVGGGNPLDAGEVSYQLIGICTTTTISDGIADLCENAVYTITADVSSFGAFTGGILEIRDGNDQMVASVNVTESVKTVSYDFSSAIAGDYTFTAHYVRSDPFRYQESESAPVTVTVIECGGCVESFGYVENEDGTYTFTYIPAADMDDAALVFTFPQSALDGVALEGWAYNGQTMQTTMDLEACETYTWTVTLTCKPLNNPQNKWTDFKVNTISKKGSLSNINCD